MDVDSSQSLNAEFERLSIPDDGERIKYDDGFCATDAPIVPISYGSDQTIIAATRRVLDAAADLMGREIYWLRTYLGEEARKQYNDPLPDDTIRALRQFRLGLLGSPAAQRKTAIRLEAELQRRVGLTAAVDQRSRLEGVQSPLRNGRCIDLTVFRDVITDAPGAIKYRSCVQGLEKSCESVLATGDGPERTPTGPTGYSAGLNSVRATESVVRAAMEYALDRDRQTVTVVHQSDRLPVSKGSFLESAQSYLEDEYAEVIIDEQTFHEQYNGLYPEEELVVLYRRTDEVCRDLLTRPEEYDVIVGPALEGIYVSAVAAEAIGGVGVAPRVTVGNGRVIASPQLAHEQRDRPADENPIGTILSGCLLFEYIGWEDAASVTRSAIAAVLADGVLPRDLSRQRTGGMSVTADEFADTVIERLTGDERKPGAGGVHTTPNERTEIRQIIAGTYNVVFEDQLSPGDIKLNQLLGEDEEADVYLPEVGLNFYYWRRWSVERRLEVLLHELAHVEEGPGERDHGDEFYERFVEITKLAGEWPSELEALFGESIDFDRVCRFVIESVHEETIESDLETARDRRESLCEEFNLNSDY